MSYFSNTNLMNSPHAPRMSETQRREFRSRIKRNPLRGQAWVKEAVERHNTAHLRKKKSDWPALCQQLARNHDARMAKAKAEAEAEAEAELIAKYNAHVKELEEYSDVLEAEQIGAEEQEILEEYLAQVEDEKRQVEAEKEYVAEYYAWRQEVAKILLRES